MPTERGPSKTLETGMPAAQCSWLRVAAHTGKVGVARTRSAEVKKSKIPIVERFLGTVPSSGNGRLRMTVANQTWVQIPSAALLAFLICSAPTMSPAATVQTVDVAEWTGRLEHEGYFPISGEPKAGAAAHLLVWMSGTWSSVTFKLVDATTMAEIQTLTLQPVSGENSTGALVGPVTVPPQPFRLKYTGQDTDGTPFDLTHPKVIVPQTIQVRFVTEYLPAQAMMDFAFVVTNTGDPGTFALSAEPDDGVTVELSAVQTTLATNVSSEHVVTARIPAGQTLSGLDRRIRAVAMRVGTPAQTNRAEARVLVTNLVEVFSNGFE